MEAARQDLIKNYQKHLREQGLSSATIERKLSSVRAYLGFLGKKYQAVDQSPTLNSQPLSSTLDPLSSKEIQQKLAALGIKVRPPRSSFFSQLFLVRLARGLGHGLVAIPSLRYSLPYALKYQRPQWFIRYQKKSYSRYLNLGFLIILCVGLGIGGYEQYKKIAVPKGKVLGTVPIDMPQYLSFQGRLVDTSENPIVVDTHFRFAVYNSPTASGAAQLYEEAKWINPDEDGIFSTLIGDSTTLPASLFKDNPALWLGVTVNENPEMTARQQVATVAYAFNSQYLQGYGVGATNVGADVNEIPVVDSNGNIIIAAAGPSLKTTSGTFKIESPTLALMTAGTSGNIGIGTSTAGSKMVIRGGLGIGNTTGTSPYLSTSAPDGGLIIEGNVGIGTTSPTQNLHVAGNLRVEGALYDSSNYSGGVGLVLTSTNTGISWGSISDLSVGDASTIDGLDSSQFLRSDTSDTFEAGGGNILTIAGVLDVNGNLSIADTDIAFDGASTNFTTTGNFSLNDSQFLVNKASDNVGIGTTGNKNKLDVNGAMAVGAYAGAYSAPSNSLIISGNIGIGFTSPDVKLQIRSAASASDNYMEKIESTYRDVGLEIGTQGNVSVIQVYSISSGGMAASKLSLLPSGGNVGIGTTNPEAKLHVAGGNILIGNSQYYQGERADGVNLNILGIDGSNNIQLGSGSAQDIYFDTYNLAKAMVIKGTSGNVGIGTTTPAAKLQVYTSSTSYTNLQGGSLAVVSPNGSTTVLSITGLSTADLVNIIDGSTEVFTILDGGNVGIGITNPSQKLDVVGNINVSGTGIFNTVKMTGLQDAGNSLGSLNQVLTSTGTGVSWGTLTSLIGGAYESPLTFINGLTRDGDTIELGGATALSKVTAINQAGYNFGFQGGNVGIGTTSPTSGYILDVNGNAKVGGTAYFADRVGIGTTNPTGKLTVVRAGTTQDTPIISSDLMVYGDGSAYIGARDVTNNIEYAIGTSNLGGAFVGSITNHNFWVRTNNINRVTIDTSGNVGIATTAPKNKLDINGSLAVGSYAGVYSAPSNSLIVSGNVGIGTTSPLNKFEVRPDAAYPSSSALALDLVGNNNVALKLYRPSGVNSQAYPWYIQAGDPNSGSRLSFLTGNAAAIGSESMSYKMTLNSSGNLGIGTTNPTSLLHVAGNAYIGGTGTFLNTKVGGLQDAGNSLGDNGQVLTSTGTGVSWGTLTSLIGGTYEVPLTFSNGLTRTDNDVHWGGQLSELTKIDMNSNNIGFWGTGNVGIGTTGPLKLLTLGAANSNTIRMYYQYPTYTGIYGEITHNGNSGGLQFTSQTANGYSDSGKISFLTSSSSTAAREVMRIDGYGNVGIGTTGPTSKLSVAGGVAIGTTSPTSVYHSSRIAPDGGLIIEGNVGIGTTSPAAGYVMDINGNLRIGNSAYINSTAYFNANVGIGTQILNAKLTIRDASDPTLVLGGAAGNPTNAGTIEFREDTDVNGSLFRLKYDGLANKFILESSAVSNILGIDRDSGRVGIGTTNPGSLLEISGTGNVTSTITSSNQQTPSLILQRGTGTDAYIDWRISNSKDTGNLDFGNKSTGAESLKVSFDINGNVGIGTTDPNQKLDVVGNINVSGTGIFQDFELQGKLLDTANSPGSNNMLLASTGTGVSWTTVASLGFESPLTFTSGLTRTENDIHLGGATALTETTAINLGGNNFGFQGTGNVGIGTTSPNYLLELSSAAGSDSTLALSDGDVAHGITGLDQTDVWARLLPISSTAGGLKLRGLSDTDATALELQGIIGATSPSDSTPAITFKSFKKANGDPTTVEGLPSSGISFQFINYSTPLLNIFAGGNVGIGTTGNKNKIDINGSAALGSYAGVYSAPSNGLIVSGNVGIGTTASKNILDVNGALAVGSYAGLYSAPSNGAIISGNVGIGTTSPTGKLTVVRAGTTQDTPIISSDLMVYGDGSAYIGGRDVTNDIEFTMGTSNLGAAFVGSMTAHDLQLRTNNATKMTIKNSSGNVGIGTTGPSALLHLSSTAAQDLFRVDDNGAGDTTPFVIDQNGNVGIGVTSVEQNLQIYSSVGYHGDKAIRLGIAGERYWDIINRGTWSTDQDAALSFASSLDGNPSADRVTFMRTGNVGIGTTNPTQKLDVVGNLNVSGTGIFQDFELQGKLLDAGNAVGSSNQVLTSTGTGVSWGTLTSLLSGTYESPLTFTSGLTRTGNDIHLGGATALTETTAINQAGYNFGFQGGNVGIGTTSPITTFQVGAIGVGNTGSFVMIDSQGRVGIGTTAVSRKLVVEGISDNVISLFESSGSGGAMVDIAHTGGGDPMVRFLDGSTLKWVVGFNNTNSDQFTIAQNFRIGAGNERFVINTDGNVGIGTTAPKNKLDINGSLAVGSYAGVYSAPSNGAIISGSVGIGITSPARSLDILYNGAASVTRIQNTSATSGTWYEVIDSTGAISGYWGYRNASNAVRPSSYELNMDNYDFNINTNWTPRLTIKAGGNTGIGTTNPSQKLDVVGVANISVGLTAPKITLTTGAQNTYLLQSDASGNASWIEPDSAGIGTSYNANNGLTLASGTFKWGGQLSELTKIDMNSNNIGFWNIGNVGIGTTSPEAKLHVAGGNILIGNSQYYQGERADGVNLNILGIDGSNNIQLGSGSAQDIYFDTYNLAKAMVIKGTSGNVGIGTSSPKNKLDINGSLAVGSYAGVYSAPSNGAIISGNVAIGTTSAAANLEISSSSNQTNLRLTNLNGADSHWELRATDLVGVGGNSFEIWGGLEGNENSRVTIDAGGNVGIGTTIPVSLLDINQKLNVFSAGNVGIGTTGNKNKLDINGSAAIGSYAGVYSAPSNGLIVSGNVGIGTTNPTQKLDVNGNVNIGSSAIIGSTLDLNGLLDVNNGIGTSGQILMSNNSTRGPEWASPSILGFEQPLTFTSGLTRTGNDIHLGGATALTETTAINLGGNNFGFQGTGNVGVGITNPGSLLEISGTGNVTSTITSSNQQTPSLILQRGTGTDAYMDWRISNNKDTGNLDFGNKSTGAESLKVSIDMNGNVGIGTTDPSQKLDVVGNINVSQTGIFGSVKISGALFDKDNFVGSDGMVLVSTGTGVSWGTASSGGTIYSGSNGITVTGTDIELGGTLERTTAVNLAGFNFGFQGTGNVGIGTTDPTQKLDVVGNLNVSGTGIFQDIDINGKLLAAGNRPGDPGQVLISTGLGVSWGSVSGLSVGDADTLDGLEATAFLRSNASDQFDAGYTLTIAGNLAIGGTASFSNLTDSRPLKLNASNQVTSGLIDLSSANDVTGTLPIIWGGTGTGTTPASGQLLIGTSTGGYSLANLTAGAGVGITNGSGSITLAHLDTSSQDSVNNTGMTVIQSLTLDDFGHLTGIGTTSLSGQFEAPLSFSSGLTRTDNDIHLGGASALEEITAINQAGYNFGFQGGNVGIGTTSPTSGYILDVNGNMKVGGTAYFTDRVGIGTTSPSQKLHVSGNTLLDGTVDLNNNILDNVNYIKGIDTDFTSIDFSTYDLIFSTRTDVAAAAERLRISGGSVIDDVSISNSNFSVNSSQLYIEQATGEIGIGTANPTQKLDVVGVANISVGLTAPKITLTTGAQNTYLLQSDASGNASWIDPSSAGIGTSYNANNGLTLASGTFKWGGTLTENTLITQGNFNTRFNLSGTGKFQIDDGGIPAFYVNDSGNVGIGTSNPLLGLHVNGAVFLPGSTGNNMDRPAVEASRITGEISGGRAATTVWDDGFLRLSAGGGTSSNVKSFIDLSGYSQVPDMNKNIVFGTSGTERMRIDGNGNIGVGTTAPVSLLDVNQKLNVFSTGNVGIGTTGNKNKLDINGSAAIGSYAGVYSAPANSLIVSGNVGIGTTSPSNWLTLSRTSTSMLTDGIRIERDPTVTNQYTIINNRLGQSNYISTGNINFDYTNGTTVSELMQISSVGNVGIGTTNPTQKLDVVGNLNISETGIFQDVDINGKLLAAGNLPGTDGMLLTSTGTGVSWTTVAALGFEAPLTFTSGLTRTDNDIHLGGAEALEEITAINQAGFNFGFQGGNVGIGTTAPTSGYVLDIAGNLRVGGTAAFNSYVGIGTTNPNKNLVVNEWKDGLIGIGVQNYSTGNSAGSVLTLTANDGQLTISSYGSNYSTAIRADRNAIVSESASSGLDIATAGSGDDIRFYTGGYATSADERLRIDGTGNVGIGTTGPSQKLDVVGNLNISETGIFQDVDINGKLLAAGNLPGTDGMLLTSTGTGVSWTTVAALGFEAPLSFSSGLTRTDNDIHLGGAQALEEVTAINQAGNNFGFQGGNVGIGTTAPTAGYILDVNGNVQVGGTAYFVSRVGIGTASPATALEILNTAEQLRLSYNSSTYTSFTTDSNGNLTLNVTGSQINLSDHLAVTAGGAEITRSSSSTALIVTQSSTGDLLNLVDGSTTVFTVKDGGNVGVGTTNPTYKLDVNGGLRVGNTALFSGNVTIGATSFLTSTKVGLLLDTASSPGTNGMLLTSTGTGVSWTTVAALGFEAPLTFTSGLTRTGNDIHLGGATALAEVTAINQAGNNFGFQGGNVGIGTTAPTSGYILDVNGNIKVGGTGYFADRVGIGTTSPAAKLEIVGSADVTQLTVRANSTQGVNNPIFKLTKSDGTDLLWLDSDSQLNTFLGYEAGKNNSLGIGDSGTYNTFVGMRSGDDNTVGRYNTSLGTYSFTTNTTGDYNTADGSYALMGNTTGSRNTALGYGAGQQQQNGSNNTFIGYLAGANSGAYSASGNVFLGYQAGYSETGSNKLYVDNSNTGSPLIWGDFATDTLGFNGNVGIGTTSPTSGYKLDVAGNLRVGGTSYFAGNVGIGTTDPGAQLEVYNGSIELDTNNGTNMDLAINEGGSYRARLGFANALGGFLSMFEDGGSRSVLIRAYGSDSYFNAGNVGIGTTGPAASFQVGNVGAGQTGSFVQINSAGNVGIGATAGTYKLYINGDVLINGNNTIVQNLRLNGNQILNSNGTASIMLSATPASNWSTLDSGAWQVYNTMNEGKAALAVDQLMGGDIFTASASGVPKFVIKNDGNVGIGTTNPGQKLDIAGITRTWDLLSNSLVLPGSNYSTLTAFAGFNGYVNLSGGLGTGGISRIDSLGNLNNIGSIKAGETLLSYGGTFAAPSPYSINSYSYSVAIEDFNGDEKVDIATANSGSDNVSVLLNDGDGTFAAKVDYTVGTSPYGVAAGDLNGDGKADIATANRDTDNVSVLLNDGDGTFAAKVDYAVGGTYPESVAMGDFNGDGKADISAANYSSNNISVFLNDGDGTFGSATNYATGTNPRGIDVGDLNGDGKADIATANLSSNNISVFLNDGDGTFGSATNYATGTSPRGIAVEDFNGDGKADIATANYSGSVSVLINNGDGTFGSSTNYTVGQYPLAVATGDLNGDGKADIATANSGTDDVSVLLNDGDGTFAAKTNYNTGIIPSAIAIRELNGDGKADITTTSGSSSSVSVLLNIAKPIFFASASSGNVGIGTTSPTAKLEIGGSTSTISNASGDITINPASGNLSLAGKSLINTLNGYFAGNVGIGTSSPNYNLQVGEGGALTSGIPGGEPGTRLHVSSNIAGGAAAISVGVNDGTNKHRATFFQRDNNSGGDWGLWNTYTAGSNRDFVIGIGSSEKMRIKTDGNVGIGTTNPQNILHVVGASQFVPGTYGKVQITTPTGTNGLILTTNDTNQYRADIRRAAYGLQLASGASTGIPVATLTINDSGNVGIGSGSTSPAYALDVGFGASDINMRAYDVYTHDGSATSFSDQRLKDIQGSFSYGLNEVLGLNPIFYKYKEGNELNLSSDFASAGLIAQEVQGLIPEAVEEGEKGYLTLHSTPIVYALINAVKELNSKVDGLASTLAKATDFIADNIAVNQRLTSPVIDTGELTADGAKLTQINSDYISPLSGNDLVIDLTSNLSNLSDLGNLGTGDSGAASDFGTLLVKGNAEFTGNVGIGQTLETKDASVSGELYAESARIKKLRAESIEGLDALFATFSAQYINNTSNMFNTNGSVSGLEENIASDSSSLGNLSDLSNLGEGATGADLLSDAANWPVIDPGNDVKIMTDVKIYGTTTLAQTLVTGPLTQDGTLLLDSGNSINVIGGTLYLQNQGMGGIDLLAGKVTIDMAGNAVFEGDLTVKGTLFAGLVKPVGDQIVFDLSNLGTGETGGTGDSGATSGFGRILARGQDGETVYSLDASGSAEFKGEVAASSFKIARDAVAAEPDLYGVIEATASAGLAKIPAGHREVTIESPFVKEKSLVYLTPVGSTANQVIYLARTSPDYQTFTAAIDRILTKDILFSWWIVN